MEMRVNYFQSTIVGAFAVSLSLVACSGTGTVGAGDGGVGSSGTSGGASGASGSSSGASGSSSGASGSSGAPAVNPTGSKPGEGCRVADDCLNVYCDCANHSVVNS